MNKLPPPRVGIGKPGVLYNVVYADPPWRYDCKNMNKGGAERHYTTMAIDEIKSLQVKKILAADCCLFIWVTWPLLTECLQVIGAWGFGFKTCAFMWVKTNARAEVNQYRLLPEDQLDVAWGMGSWTRANTEACMLGIRGNPKPIDKGVHQVIYSPRVEHSRKPDEVMSKIVKLCGDVPRIELFARRKVDGWDAWGNEV